MERINFFCNWKRFITFYLHGGFFMENYNASWEFKLDGSEQWQTVNLPHDWLIGDVNNLYADGVGMYRKKFFWANDKDVETSGQQRTWLRFDGVIKIRVCL